MAKELCKRVDDNEHVKNREKYLRKVLPPEYMCGKCGRVASREKMVCKPQKVKG